MKLVVCTVQIIHTCTKSIQGNTAPFVKKVEAKVTMTTTYIAAALIVVMADCLAFNF